MLFAATVQHAKEILDSLPPQNSRMIGGDVNMKKAEREPHFVNLCEKVDYEWKFELTDGSVVSIYPYKYSPKENQLFEFSVASNSKKSADALIAHFNSVVGE